MTLKRLLILYFSAVIIVGMTVFDLSPKNNLLQLLSSLSPGSQTLLLPDLAPFAIYDLRVAKLSSGRTILKFSASFVNRGKSQFELIGSPSGVGSSQRNVNQRIVTENGSSQDKLVGSFEWHAAHDHYHYGDFADYVFGSVRLLSSDKAPIAIRQKTTFCLRDNELAMPELVGAPKSKTFAYCTQTRQGVSVGWTDIYDYTLPDQYIDVHDMPAGIYSLSFFLDPNQRFTEERKDNNISTVFFELDPAKKLVRPIAAAAPFSTSRNNFPSQFLIRGEGAEVYVMHNNKKRWLKTVDIFNSYGHPWDQIYSLTQSMVDVIPNNNLIRLTGTEEVYAVNDLGYKRHILNPEVFSSYQFTGPDVADINKTEFESYPYSNLIRIAGDGDIYLIDGTSKEKLGKLDEIRSSDYDLNAIHTVNQIDFDSYITLP